MHFESLTPQQNQGIQEFLLPLVLAKAD